MKKIAALLSLVMVSTFAFAGEPAGAGAGAFPTFGASFDRPAGAVSLLPTRPGDVCVYGNQKTGDLLLLEAEPTSGKTLEAYVGNLVGKMGATRDSGTYEMGGEKAVKLTMPAKDKGPSRSAYVSTHDGRTYVLSAMSIDPARADQLLESAMPGVSFSAAESPEKHLKELYGSPFQVFGAITVNGPACLRPYSRSDAQLVLGCHDFAIADDPFLVVFNKISVPGGKRFTETTSALGDMMKERLGLSEAPVWVADATIKNLYVSQWIHAANPAAAQLKVLERFCTYEIADGKQVQISFTISDRKDVNPDAYMEASDAMLASMKAVAGGK